MQALGHLVRGLLSALICAVLASAAHAQIVYREVVASGNGGDPSAALVDAIENAIGQVGGMKMSSATSMSMSEMTRGNTTTLEQDFKQHIERLTRGVVKSYSVLESGTSSGSGRSFVKIKALIPTYKASEQLKRLKLAVIPLSVVGAASSKPDAAKFAESVSAALEAYLTQSRKFAMIDGRYSDSRNRELSRVNSRNAPIEETVKVGMRVGADYIVLTALKEFSAQQVQQQRVTGRVVSRMSAPVSIDVRVLDIATGQIKFAQTYVNPGRLHSNMSLSQYAADIGADIGQVINTAIYPIAVISASAGLVTLNQGGDTVQVGRIYRLVSLGQNLVDPYTKESLGQEEREVASVEVTSVTDRTATAKVVSGNLPASVKPGSVLARVLPDEPATALNVQVTLPILPGMNGSQGSGKSKDDEDW
jgi:curli biogenesis system outer membrane secretion channel CsgG